jgi:hypothetical protein
MKLLIQIHPLHKRGKGKEIQQYLWKEDEKIEKSFNWNPTALMIVA